MAGVVLQTNIPGTKPKHGKVRDIYDLGDSLIIAASDRISAFDVIMKNGIPYKGIVLTRISKFWFDFLAGEVEHHLITDDVAKFPAPFNSHTAQLAGRSMLVKKTQVLPIECIIRGYITGSGWKEYQQTGSVCGHKLPAGLKQCQQLPEPIFTPSTKAEHGAHDENIDFETCVKIIGAENAAYIRDKSIAVFKAASAYAESRGIILADTKFEWGLRDGRIILIDEVLTPDSSRFWPADKYEPGRDQESYDKQFVRNYLESINFNKSGPGVTLPEDIVAKTSAKYVECYEHLTGMKFQFCIAAGKIACAPDIKWYNNAMNTIVRLKEIQFDRGERAILWDISWTIERGQHWALLGANGSGKTTLLKIMAGYEWPTTGSVEVLGQKYGQCNLPELRKHIGVVSASLDCRVPGDDTALDIVTSGLDATLGLYRHYSEAEYEQARRTLAMVNGEKFAAQKFATLSQGEQQRVLIARAMVNRPALLVLDEPCNGLDPGAKERFLSDLSRLANHQDAPTMVMVTHYIEEIDPWIAWVMVLRNGEILASGRKSETLNTMILSRAFGMDVLVKKEGLRYTLRS